jgi:8-oxo-dGTP pyrophosphatase MutT (NUDIX family)
MTDRQTAPERLAVTPDALHAVLAARPYAEAAIDGFARSAVLVTVLLGEGEPAMLFTRRTDKVEHHKGQISFPGGRLDPGEDLQTCALRETHEEIGVRPADVRIVGRLDDTWTPTRYVITPFVGVVPHPYAFKVSAAEIDDLLIIPLRRLLKPDKYDENEMTFRGRSAAVPFYYIDDTIIWGATARILRQFLQTAFP